MLGKKQKVRIASLINTIMVAQQLQKEGTLELWVNVEKEHTIALYKEFGVELPALKIFLPSTELVDSVKV